MQNSNAFTLVISAESGEELKNKVFEAASQYGATAALLGAVAPKEVPKSTVSKAPKEKPKPTTDPFSEDESKPEKTPTQAQAQVSDDPFADDEAPKPKEPTFDDVKKALQDVSDNHPEKMEAAKRIVQALGVTKVREIQPKQFAKALDLCKKALS